MSKRVVRQESGKLVCFLYAKAICKKKKVIHLKTVILSLFPVHQDFLVIKIVLPVACHRSLLIYELKLGP